jgi:hypothetical protein
VFEQEAIVFGLYEIHTTTGHNALSGSGPVKSLHSIKKICPRA